MPNIDVIQNIYQILLEKKTEIFRNVNFNARNLGNPNLDGKKHGRMLPWSQWVQVTKYSLT